MIIEKYYRKRKSQVSYFENVMFIWCNFGSYEDIAQDDSLTTIHEFLYYHSLPPLHKIYTER